MWSVQTPSNSDWWTFIHRIRLSSSQRRGLTQQTVQGRSSELVQKYNPGTVTHTCNANTWEAGAGGQRIQTSPSFTVRPDFTDHSNGTRLSALSYQFTKEASTDHPLRILQGWKANQKILICWAWNCVRHLKHLRSLIRRYHLPNLWERTQKLCSCKAT